MAKKARQRAEDGEPAFEFPVFDERGFLEHEFEQFYATVIAFIFGVVISIAAFAVAKLGFPFVVPFGVGLAGVVGGTLVIQRIRPASKEYTKGDWATLIVLMFFGFLGFWLLLAGLFK